MSATDPTCQCSKCAGERTEERIAALEGQCAAMREALEAAQECLRCVDDTGDGFQAGHWCPHCDEFVDRNGVVRQRISAALASDAGRAMLERVRSAARAQCRAWRKAEGVAERERSITSAFADECDALRAEVETLRVQLAGSEQRGKAILDAKDKIAGSLRAEVERLRALLPPGGKPDCPDCHGTGRVGNVGCATCAGLTPGWSGSEEKP